MKILFIGDIYSKSGRDVVRKYLPELKKTYDIDLVIANGENSAHGKGMTKKIYEELMDIGIEAFTMGNHFLKNKDITKWLDSVKNVARPANIDGIVEGKGSIVVETKKGNVRITNLIGRVFIKEF
jgi:calcineurin-like phosphoesterase